MVFIEPLRDTHLEQVQVLINMHLSTMVPGWFLPEAFISSRLHRNPWQHTLDPWVRERATLCALQKQRVAAAAHLLRYGNGPEVSHWYQDAGDLAWLLAWPNAGEVAAALLAGAGRQFAAWEVKRQYAWDAGLPIGPFVGVPEVWPRIAGVLERAGYHPRTGQEGEEIIYGGPLDSALRAAPPPVVGMTLLRTMGTISDTRFVALVDGQEVGRCECATDLTWGGALPALRGWGELSEPQVSEARRNRGIGSCLAPAGRRGAHDSGGDSRGRGERCRAVLPASRLAGAGPAAQRLAAVVSCQRRQALREVRAKAGANCRGSGG